MICRQCEANKGNDAFPCPCSFITSLNPQLEQPYKLRTPENHKQKYKERLASSTTDRAAIETEYSVSKFNNAFC
eukprot:4896484-Pleurochrysis_carterae.AAC.1